MIHPCVSESLEEALLEIQIPRLLPQEILTGNVWPQKPHRSQHQGNLVTAGEKVKFRDSAQP